MTDTTDQLTLCEYRALLRNLLFTLPLHLRPHLGNLLRDTLASQEACPEDCEGCPRAARLPELAELGVQCSHLEPRETVLGRFDYVLPFRDLTRCMENRQVARAPRWVQHLIGPGLSAFATREEMQASAVAARLFIPQRTVPWRVR